MDPKPVTVGSLFSSGNTQYWIPRYQRSYGWTTDKLHGLWRDIGQIFSEDESKDHFLGIILGHMEVVNEEFMKQRVELIDGQQRMTTLLLLLTAIYHYRQELARSKPGKKAGKKSPKARFPGFYFLRDRNGDKTHEKVLELLPGDSAHLDSIMNGKWLREYLILDKSPVISTYSYFRYCLWAGKDSFDRTEVYSLPLPKNKIERKLQVQELWNHRWAKNENTHRKPFSDRELDRLDAVIQSQLCILRILIEKTDEDPVLIFDSINGKRMEFTQWDHVRAYFAKVLGRDDSKFEEWDKAQNQLAQAADFAARRRGSTPINDEFLYNLVIMLSAEQKDNLVKPNKNRTYLQLVKLIKLGNDGKEPIKSYIEQFNEDVLLPAARVYSHLVAPDKISLRNVKNADIPRQALDHISQINAFSKGPADPVVLNALMAWMGDHMDEASLLSCLRAIESFLARKVLNGDDLSPMRSEFMNMLRSIRKDDTRMENFHTLLLKTLRQSMPSNADIENKFKDKKDPRQFYTKGDQDRVAAILRGIEQGISGGAAHTLPFGNGGDEFNIDHILPQQCRGGLNKEWSECFKRWGMGESDAAEAIKRIDCLGNLAMHASYSNKSDQAASFEAKKKAYSGTSGKKTVVSQHTEYVRNASKWTAAQIDERTDKLVAVALRHWNI